MIEQNKIGLGKVIFTFLYILLFPFLLLLLSGDWCWFEGWIFSVWYSLLCFTTIFYLYRKDPSLLAERYRKPGTANQKGWDKYAVFGLMLGFLCWVIIMPLDAKRFCWTSGFPLWTKCIGGTFLVFSFFFFYRSYTDNTFVSALVRIQEERKQQVVSTGVYCFVRHPMYLGGILLFLGTPLLLGSMYGLLIGLVMLLLLAARIIGEEKMLISELEGYTEYKKKVKYRLFPYIW
jgi:protein-S-isoprenylcysteine O-methyltransferase Ste14